MLQVIILFSHPRGIDEIIQLPDSLQETYCLPVLLYASPPLYLKPKQLSELKVCWNIIYHNIFISAWENQSNFLFSVYADLIFHMLLCCGEFLSTITFQRLIILHCLVYSGVTYMIILILINCLNSVFKPYSACKWGVYSLYRHSRHPTF